MRSRPLLRALPAKGPWLTHRRVKPAASPFRSDEGWLRAVFENANDPMFVYHFDEAWRPLPFRRVNAAAERVYGFTREALLRRSAYDLIDAPAAAVDALLAELRAAGSFIRETRHRTRDGRVLPVEVSAHFFQFEGRPTVLTIARDLTERRRDEQRLREAHEELASVLEATNDLFVSIDRGWRYRYINARAAAVTRRRPDELIGRVIWEAFPALVGSETERRLREAMDSRREVHFETLSTVSGRWVEASIYPAPEGLFVFGRDITDRKLADDELKLHSRVLESMTEGVSLSDDAGVIVYTNPAEDRMFGYEPGELVGKHVTEQNAYPPEENRARVEAVIEHLVRAGAWRGEWLNRRKDGSTFVTSSTITTVDLGGRRYFVCVQRDVTSEKSAEEAARLSEQQAEQAHALLDTFFDSAPIGLAFFDRETRYTRVNRALAEMNGLPAEAHIDKPIDEVIGPVAALRLAADVRRVLASGEPLLAQQLVGTTRARPDEPRCWSLGYYPIHQGGFLVGVGVVCEDVTDRIAQEQARRDSEHRLTIALDTADLGTFEVDCVTGEAAYSARSKAHLGFGAEEAVSLERAASVIHPDDRDRVLEAGRRAMTEGGDYEQEYRVLTPAGVRWISARARCLRDGEGRPRRMIGVCMDVTQRREHLQQLEALNQTLERRVAERTAVAEQRAEQLRQLTSELTQAEQRERRRLAQALHDGLQQMLVAAKLRINVLGARAGDDLRAPLHQVDELLQQSIEVSRSLSVQLSPPILHDAGLAPALEWLARWMAEHHALMVEVRADPRAEPQAEEVRVLLFEATRELLFNVTKHARVDRARVTMARLGAGATSIVIEDEGVGFDPARPAAGRSTSQGIGLVSVRERLGFLGGRLEIRSSVGQGTRMTLIAPRSQARGHTGGESSHEPAAGAPSPASARVRSNGDAIRVLLADDHKILRQGLVSLLEEEPDIEIVGEASDGAMAVEMAMRVRPDVVVMDITMPKMSGIEATRRITRKLPEVRVIGLSMHNEADMASALRDAGAVSYLTKGGPSEDLIGAIRAAAH